MIIAGQVRFDFIVSRGKLEDIAHFTSVCELAARQAGQLLLDWRGRARVTAKAPADLVTEADFAAQQRIREIIERESAAGPEQRRGRR